MTNNIISAVERWTQSTVWYLFLPIMEKYDIKVTRDYITRIIRDMQRVRRYSRSTWDN
jgi:hypothetical protein